METSSLESGSTFQMDILCRGSGQMLLLWMSMFRRGSWRMSDFPLLLCMSQHSIVSMLWLHWSPWRPLLVRTASTLSLLSCS